LVIARVTLATVFPTDSAHGYPAPTVTAF